MQNPAEVINDLGRGCRCQHEALPSERTFADVEVTNIRGTPTVVSWW